MTRRIENGADFRGPLLAGGSAGTSGQVLTSAGAGAVPTWSPAGGFTGGTLTSNLTLAAGGTSLSPLTFQSGTNLTSATAGAMEYDGKVIYSTPVARGVSPSMMYFRLNSDLAGSNVNTAQSIFGVGATLQASTVYAFEIICAFGKTAGATSHNFFLGFDGGTATFNNFTANVFAPVLQAAPPTNNNVAAGSIFYGVQNSITELAYINAIAGATRTIPVSLFGTLSVANSGTFIPRYRMSTAPGGAYSTLSGSYIAIWPIGAAGANTSVGPWA